MKTNSITPLIKRVSIAGNRYIHILLLSSCMTAAKAQVDLSFPQHRSTDRTAGDLPFSVATSSLDQGHVIDNDSTLVLLPVINITNFAAGTVNCDAKLQWSTTNEINVAKYMVEQSKDGITFNEMGSVNALPSIYTNTYSIMVPQPNGLYYYRLKLLNTGGNMLDRSKTIVCKIRCSVKETMRLYPNFVTDQSTSNLSIATSYRGKVELIVTNYSGQAILKLQKNVATDNTTIPINISTLPKAGYHITVLKEDGTRLGPVQKLVRM